MTLMLSGKEELAGGYRLASVRRTKKYLYLVEVLILIAAIIIVVIAESRVTLVPFFIPINSFIYFVLLMGLIIAVESFVFRAMEMRLIKSESTKFYICKMGIRRAIVAIAICVVIILVLWLPFIHDAVEGAFASEGSLTNSHSTAATSYASFYNMDPLGLSEVSQIVISASGGEARVYLVTEEDFEAHKNSSASLAKYRINTDQYIAATHLTITVESLPFGKYYLVLDTSTSTASAVHYSIESSLSGAFLNYVPLFALLYAIAYAGWIVYLTPLKKKYSEGAIYR